MATGTLEGDVVEPLSPPATFLVTDIVGSSRLWDDHASEMSVALARHDGLLRRLIADHEGRVFKGAGDGVWAIFERAEPALLAALAIQATFRTLSWGDLGEISIRIALNSGVAELRDGD